MFTDSFAGFVITATILTLAPGLDTAMVLRSAAADGAWRGAATAVGVALGCLCWGGAAAFGLSALLHAWPLAFVALKWSGAFYLGWLGLQLLIRPRSAFASACDANAAASGFGLSLGRGFVTNILNPKVGLFYLTLLPQFVPQELAGPGYAFLLACSHVAIALGWFVLLAVITSAIRPWFRRPHVVATFDRLTGGIFILLGLRLVN